MTSKIGFEEYSRAVLKHCTKQTNDLFHKIYADENGKFVHPTVYYIGMWSDVNSPFLFWDAGTVYAVDLQPYEPRCLDERFGSRPFLVNYSDPKIECQVQTLRVMQEIEQGLRWLSDDMTITLIDFKTIEDTTEAKEIKEAKSSPQIRVHYEFTCGGTKRTLIYYFASNGQTFTPPEVLDSGIDIFTHLGAPRLQSFHPSYQHLEKAWEKSKAPLYITGGFDDQKSLEELIGWKEFPFQKVTEVRNAPGFIIGWYHLSILVNHVSELMPSHEEVPIKWINFWYGDSYSRRSCYRRHYRLYSPKQFSDRITVKFPDVDLTLSEPDIWKYMAEDEARRKQIHEEFQNKKTWKEKWNEMFYRWPAGLHALVYGIGVGAGISLVGYLLK